MKPQKRYGIREPAKGSTRRPVTVVLLDDQDQVCTILDIPQPPIMVPGDTIRINVDVDWKCPSQ